MLCLGEKIESAIAPLLEDIAANPSMPFSSEIVDIVIKLNDHRKSISVPVFDLFKILVQKSYFSSNFGEFTEKKLLYLNQIFGYAKQRLQAEAQMISTLLG